MNSAKVDFIHNNLICPKCFLEIFKNEKQEDVIECSCRYKINFINDIPVFVANESEYIDKTKSSVMTNPYSAKCLELIN